MVQKFPTVFLLACLTFIASISIASSAKQIYAQGDIVSAESSLEPTSGNYFSDGSFSEWFYPENWDGSFEVGLNGASGNSNSLNLRVGYDLERKTPLIETAFGFDYSKATANGIETQNFANLQWDWDRVFSEGSPWSSFSKTNILFDEFRPFDLRLAINGGVGYKWIDDGVTLFRTRTGAGVSREFGGPNSNWIPEAVFGIDFNRQLGKFQKLTATVDYFPAFSNFNDYRLVSDFSWEMLLHEVSNLSLKFSVLDTYDSTPDGAVANDINYALLLLWKM